MPKTLALAHAERFAITLSLPIDFLGRALRPVIAFLTWVTSGIVRLFGAEVSSDAQITAEELRLIVERGGEQGILEAEEEQMINAVIELGDQRVHEVMVPRIHMITLAADATLDDAIDKVIEEGHSRIPVYEGTIDEIVGILYAKDLLPFLKGSVDERPSLRSILRTPVFVPESMTVDDLLHELQRRKVHLAVVLDEYGGTAGLVTIEDLLEEIVGEIQDEYDEEEPLIVKISDDEARIDGRAAIDDLEELFDTDLGLDDEDQYDTVGGLIYHRIGGVPKPGDRVQVDGLTLTVETTDGQRVGKVLVVREPRDGPATTRTTADRRRPRRPDLGVDRGDDDLLEPRPGGRAEHAGAVELGEGLVAVAAGLLAGVLAGAGPLEDRHDLGDLRGRPVRRRVERLQPRPVLGAGRLVGVDDRERLLAVGDVRGLLAGRPLRAPDAEQVVVELEREARAPSRSRGSGR